MSVDPTRNLWEVGHDITLMPPLTTPKELQKACLFIVNTNASYRSSLGTDPISNAADFAKFLKYYDYPSFVLCTPHAFNVLDRVEYFCRITTESLIIYYCGQDFSMDGHKTDFVFDDGKISTDEFSQTLIKSKCPSSKLILINDFGNSKTIFNAKKSANILPSNVLSLMAKPKRGEAKKYIRMFMYYLLKELTENSSITLKKLKKKIKKPMKKFGYKVKIGATDEMLLELPLL